MFLAFIVFLSTLVNFILGFFLGARFVRLHLKESRIIPVQERHIPSSKNESRQPKFNPVSIAEEELWKREQNEKSIH